MTGQLTKNPFASAQALQPDTRLRAVCAACLLAFAVAAVPVSAFAASDTASGDKAESAGSMMNNSATAETTHDVMRASEQGADGAMSTGADSAIDKHEAKATTHDAMKATREAADGATPASGDATKMETDKGMRAPNATSTGAATAMNAVPTTNAGERFITRQGADEMLVDELTDAEVVTGDGKNLGEVEDVLIGSDQRIRALVVEVGGFLGIGEKEVAVNFDRFEQSRSEDGKLRLRLQATTDELKAAEKFVPLKDRKG